MLAPHMAHVKMGAAKPTLLVLDSNPSCVYHAKVFATTLPIGQNLSRQLPLGLFQYLRIGTQLLQQ